MMSETLQAALEAVRLQSLYAAKRVDKLIASGIVRRTDGQFIVRAASDIVTNLPNANGDEANEY